MPALDEVTWREKCALLSLYARLAACAKVGISGLEDMQPNGHFIGDPTVESARRFPVMVQAMRRQL
jgi:hypothetical protein